MDALAQPQHVAGVSFGVKRRFGVISTAAAGAQSGHRLAELGRHWSTRKDTASSAIEYRRTPEELWGYARTRHRDGSGP